MQSNFRINDKLFPVSVISSVLLLPSESREATMVRCAEAHSCSVYTSLNSIMAHWPAFLQRLLVSTTFSNWRQVKRPAQPTGHATNAWQMKGKPWITDPYSEELRWLHYTTGGHLYEKKGHCYVDTLVLCDTASLNGLKNMKIDFGTMSDIKE